MLSLFQGLRWLHIAAGSVALIVFWIPIAFKKGGRTHIRAGWVYVTCMSVVVVSAFTLSGMAFADPLGVRHITRQLSATEMADFISKSRMFATFLAYLAGLTLAAGWQGIWVLRTRRDPKSFRTPFNLALNALVILSALIVLRMGLHLRNGALIGLSPVGMFVSGGNLAYLLRGPQSRMDWWYQHLASMIGTGIAGYTAFLVFGGARLFPALSHGQYAVVFWLMPTAIGSPAIALTVAYYKKKFGENTRKPTAGNPAGQTA